MPALRGFVSTVNALCKFGRVTYSGRLLASAFSLCRSRQVFLVQQSRARVLSNYYSMPPKRKAASKAADAETAAPKTEAKKRGRAKKEENDDEKEETTSEPPPKLAKKVSDGLKSMDFSSSAKTEDGRAWNLKIASWNINGVRAWLNKDGLSYLQQEKPDVLCVQETKCSESKLPPELKVDGYKAHWVSAEKEGYAGTGMYTKTDPIAVTYGIGKAKHDNEGRVITAEFEKFYLVTAYVPNSGQGLVRLKYRTKEWDEDFMAYLKDLDAKKPVILCGDLNVAHLDIDLKNPKGNKRNAGFTDEERAGFGKLLEQGFIDSFRTLYPEKEEAYTFWSNFRQAREKNVGWRLDYFVMSERLKKDLCDSVIRTHVMGSDHCPIVLLLAL
ncbi:exodeoxyribonuclease-like [Babylonia areolata]|uniref:exodeoxyribonuclease-like n=1 Tax=Babylonia areolata TaxID=304850 RepID=UPI003FD462BF